MFIRKNFILISIFCLLIINAEATHNRAGEITYKYVSGYTYEITISTYTSITSLQNADRDYLDKVCWSDGDCDIINRFNGIDANGNGFLDGVILIPGETRYNEYKTTHTFPGPGIYTISMEDPNRNGGVINMLNSLETAFYIETVLKIGSSANPLNNNSLQFLNPLIDIACKGKIFIYNPGANDPDGVDSISYSLVSCKSSRNTVVQGYYIPANMTIDAVKGDVIWNTPDKTGEYNIAIEISEWYNGKRIGFVVRDIQITVINCTNNPPLIAEINDTCVTAGDTLAMLVNASDPDFNKVTLTAIGEPLILSVSPATFVSPSPATSVSSTFFWNTVCSHVRINPYQVVFKAKDDKQNEELVDMETVWITIVCPSPKNPKATATGNNIQLSWDASVCTNATGYKIYRRIDTYGFVPKNCETGVPSYTGYSEIGAVNGLNTTSFLDDNGGAGLIHGNDYCYMVVATFPDGALSYASTEFCAQLIKDVPVITHVSIYKTGKTDGADTVMWSPPDTIDKVKYPGPYHYNIYRSVGLATTLTLVGSTPANVSLFNSDTVFVDPLLNTQDNQYTYRIALFSGSDSVGASHNATSIFLSASASDNLISLNWTETVPWINTKYEVYRKDGPDSAFKLINTLSQKTYSDSGLENDRQYCYYINSIGAYSAPGIINPLLNKSQEKCEIPIDLTPPCAPKLTLKADCELYEDLLTWNNPNNSCTDDVDIYNIYYTSFFGGPLSIIKTIAKASDTTFLYTNASSIAGCFAISSLDSLKTGLNGIQFRNESARSDTICADNCPIYKLPNTFSPNGDNINDLFIPFPYKYVESINMKIYNRWGILLFETNDPKIRWDGKYQRNQKECTEGVYYYICEVNSIRLSGINQFVLTGFIHLFRDEQIRKE